jgi:hypothetical protein
LFFWFFDHGISVLVCVEDLGDKEFGLFFGEDRGEDFDVCVSDAVNARPKWFVVFINIL